jgi:hypothetical protein
MSDTAPWQINPCTVSERILPSEKVATMGSCFAQHIAKHIAASGLHYYITEKAPEDLEAAEAQRRNYGVFSARYGNMYTVRQALQLFQRAFGIFEPHERVWSRGSSYVDPFRPQIEPNGFASSDAVIAATEAHLACVREMFLNANWIVFTLGLTEAWRSKVDGAIYPSAPGVAGGSFDSNTHEFINFTVDQVRSDLSQLINEVGSINPGVKFLLTVSPVPLIATYENRHVLVSTTASKAILRVVADEATRTFKNVWYFPSFEIITSPAAGNNYFEDDLRGVRSIGVAHVMRAFTESFLAPPSDKELFPPDKPVCAIQLKSDIVCDEEAITKDAVE